MQALELYFYGPKVLHNDEHVRRHVVKILEAPDWHTQDWSCLITQIRTRPLAVFLRHTHSCKPLEKFGWTYCAWAC